MSKKDLAYQFIKKKIISENLNEGELISENMLVEELGISRTPIRSALQRLELEGFLKIAPGRGAIVREMTITEASELYDLRIALETFVIKKIINLITQDDLKALNKILQDQRKALEKGDITEGIEYDMEFHYFLIRKYKNSRIQNLFENFKDRFGMSGYKALVHAGRSTTTLIEHEAILGALEQKDMSKAIAAIESHLENGKKNLI
jgi:DNA-binding GntR family transcriptional regulator